MLTSGRLPQAARREGQCRIPPCKSSLVSDGVHYSRVIRRIQPICVLEFTHAPKKVVRPDGARRAAIRRRASASVARAKAQRCTRQLQALALPHSATLCATRHRNLCTFASATFALPRVPPLHCRECNFCVSASAYLRSRYALWPYRTGLRGTCERKTRKSTSQNTLQPLFSGARRISAPKKRVNSSRFSAHPCTMLNPRQAHRARRAGCGACP